MTGAWDPDDDGDDDSTPQGDSDHDYWSPGGQQLKPVEGASALPQVQQVTDPNNAPVPQDDQLPEGVMFPIDPGFAAEWETGPQGAQPKAQKEGARADEMPQDAAASWGESDARNGRSAIHKDTWTGSPQRHGDYTRAWALTKGLIHGIVGNGPMSRAEFGKATGRPDLHHHYLESYAQGKGHARDTKGLYATSGRAQEDPEGNRCSDCGHLPGCGCTHHCDNDPEVGGHPQHPSRTSGLRREADAWSAPHATTDDFQAPYNSAITEAQPRSQNMDSQSGDYEAGKAAGKADKAAGQRPAFADNSSGVSPYVKGYSEGFGGAQGPHPQQDVPRSMGGDSGQAFNAQQAQQSFQVARASRRRASASFAPPALFSNADFSKGYNFASMWKPGRRLVSQGSAAFEAGLYAGITDQPPALQRAWLSAHAAASGGHPQLGRRIALHRSFTAKQARKAGIRAQGAYLRVAGTTTDLITDGPGTSPDPMGATPLNGPGTAPEMGGRSDPAKAGGAPPYQGAPPLPGGPVVSDEVVGRSQEPSQPNGPFTQTFSGNHPENIDLAPVAENKANQPGYSNKSVYEGDPRGSDRLAAFRRTVQANLAKMQAAGV